MVGKIKWVFNITVLLAVFVGIPLGALGFWVWDVATRPPAKPPATIYFHYDNHGVYTGKTVLGK